MDEKQRKAEQFTDVYLSVMLLVFLLFPGFQGYSAITASKFWFFVTLTVLWLGALAWLRFPGVKLSELWQDKTLRWIGLFLLWVMLSTVFSPWPLSVTALGGSWKNGAVPLLLYGLTAVFVSRYGRFRRKYIRLLGISVLLCCLVGVTQIAGGDPLRLYPHGWRFQDAGTLYSGMYLGTVGNTLVLSSVLSLAVPALVLTALRYRKWDLLLLFPAGLAVYVLFRTDASSGELALLGSTALVLPWLCPKKYRRWILPGEGVALLGALAYVYTHPSMGGMFSELSAILCGHVDDSFGSHRIQIWRAVWDTVGSRPLLGGGTGTLGYRIDVMFSRFVPETGETLFAVVNNAHNEYLEYIADVGVPGLVFYVGAMVSTVAASRRKGGPVDPVSWGVIAYWIQAFFALGLCLSAPYLWIFWGLWIGRNEAHSEHEKND